MHYELNLTTSPLRGTPLTRGYRYAQPSAIHIAARSRASHGWPPPGFAVLLLKIAKQFSRGELLLSLAILFLLKFLQNFKRRVAALIGSIVLTKILAESQEESFRYSRCKDTMQKMSKTAIMKKWSIFFATGIYEATKSNGWCCIFWQKDRSFHNDKKYFVSILHIMFILLLNHNSVNLLP